MKNSTRKAITSALVGASCLLAANTGWSATFNLTAKAFTKTLDLASGPRDVLMWGFALNGGQATSPGPALNVPWNDSTLVVNLTNELPVPVSIVIPNQNGYVRADTVDTPEFTVGDPYAAGRPGAARPRALSLVKEVAPGGSATYTWNGVTPGTYLYYSGSHSALQVQMGLYGMMKKNAATVLAYPTLAGMPPVTAFPITQELVWVFGEIDFAVHDAVGAGTYESTIKSMIHSVPDVVLLNGEPLAPGEFSTGLPGFGAPQPTLIRMLNTCYDERIPIITGYHLRVVAEDGRRFTYPKVENAVNLPAMKTRDVQLTAPRGTVVKYYDRRQLTLQ